MIEFALGTVFGAASGYAARAWLSARRRRAARAARIAGGSGGRHFVPFKSEGNSGQIGENATSMVVKFQPGASDAGQAQAKEFRVRVDSAARV